MNFSRTLSHIVNVHHCHAAGMFYSFYYFPICPPPHFFIRLPFKENNTIYPIAPSFFSSDFPYSKRIYVLQFSLAALLCCPNPFFLSKFFQDHRPQTSDLSLTDHACLSLSQLADERVECIKRHLLAVRLLNIKHLRDS